MTRRPSDAPEMVNLRRLNRMLDQAFSGWSGFDNGGTITSAWLPPVDIFEDKDSIKIVTELPGVRPEDVRISMENNLLTIRGEKKQVAEERSDRVHRYERSYGVFERSFALPNTIDPERVVAEFDNGVLTITLPKVERARPREIQVGRGEGSSETRNLGSGSESTSSQGQTQQGEAQQSQGQSQQKEAAKASK
jgi:HSP20 family protein